MVQIHYGPPDKRCGARLEFSDLGAAFVALAMRSMGAVDPMAGPNRPRRQATAQTGDLAVRRAPIIPGHQVVGVVEALGAAVTELAVGERVGVAWLHRTCGCCSFCTSHRENLCDTPQFTGWTVQGGFAECLVAPASFTYPLPDGFTDLQAAPLLCAGIIGYRCLRKTGIDDWAGARLGLYGFGAAGHVAIQIARARGPIAFSLCGA